jgi:hypothetical protein
MGVASATLLVGTLGSAPALAHQAKPTAAEPDDAAPYETIELQARTNLLVNDNGYNLPPGSSFNSITPAIDDDADVAFRVQLVYDQSDGTTRPGLWVGGHGSGSIAY